MHCRTKNIRFILRPNIDEFLNVIASESHIVFYTSRKEDNARAILETISEESVAMNEIYKGVNLLHQDMCKKASGKKFTKDLDLVQKKVFNPQGKNYAMKDIIMIDDSPEKFNSFSNHVIICISFSYKDKQATTVCHEQLWFITKLV